MKLNLAYKGVVLMPDSSSWKKKIVAFTLAGTLLVNPILVQAELGDQILKYSMEHEDVKVLQQHLINLNFLDLEETTTYYGDQTLNAVKKFQEFIGLNPDGVFGSKTFEALKKIIDLKPLVHERVLKEGDEGEDVKALQERLKILGFLDIDECTTYFGSQTRQAIKDFQKIYGLKVDGIAGDETIDAINEALKGNKRRVTIGSSRGSSRSNSLGERIVATAMQYLGCPYVYKGSSPKGFDCSGFTQYVYKQFGINISRSSSTQANDGVRVDREDLQIGDLLIFTGTRSSTPGHTGIYIGNGKFIHSSSGKARGVTISDLDSEYYNKRFLYGRRLY